MALLHAGYTDYNGRRVPYSIDTDDLDDREYHYLCKVKKYASIDSRANTLYFQILNSRVKADDIENDERYQWVNDEMCLLMLDMKLEERKGNK